MAWANGEGSAQALTRGSAWGGPKWVRLEGTTSHAAGSRSTRCCSHGPHPQPLLLQLMGSACLISQSSARAGSVMQLLTRMQSSSETGPASGDGLAARVPRLWPFFRHTLTSVRRSCVQCLRALLSADTGGDPIASRLASACSFLDGVATAQRTVLNPKHCGFRGPTRCPASACTSFKSFAPFLSAGSQWVRAVAPTSLRLVFQNLLHEQDDAVRQSSQALWSTLLQRLGAAGIAGALPADTLEVLSFDPRPISFANLTTGLQYMSLICQEGTVPHGQECMRCTR